MQLIHDLRAEHDLIEQVVGSLRAYVEQRLAGAGDPADGARYIEFFRLFAGNFHHAKEEDTLFVALRRQADLPEEGPIAALTADHRRMAGVLGEMAGLVGAALADQRSRERLRELAIRYSHGLWHHIDAENSVLLPESEGRLLKKGVRELPSRAMTPAERDARAQGEALLTKYPPVTDPGIIRGDGCVSCEAFPESCRGLEREWWNEWEWEEFEDHQSGD
jgi:hemerythrin-like domain-containing protein